MSRKGRSGRRWRWPLSTGVTYYTLLEDCCPDEDMAEEKRGLELELELKERPPPATPAAIVPADQHVASTLQLAQSAELQSREKLDEYDPFDKRENKSVSDGGALMHLLKGSLGTGILAMPMAFRNSGLAFGAVATLVIGFVCTHCVGMLVSVSQSLCRRTRTPSLDYAQTAEAAFLTGPPATRGWATTARRITNGTLLATYYSTSVVYVVFIATSVKQVGDHLWQEKDVRLYMAMAMPLLMAIGLVRQLRWLVPFSMMANGFIVVSFGITLAYIFTDLPPTDHDRSMLASPAQIPLFFSTVIFAMEGIGVVLPVENSMKTPQHFLGCPGVLNIAMVIVISLYAVIGFFGYVKYGEATMGSVTLNLPVEDILAQVVKLLIAAAILFTYGLQLYVPTQIVFSPELRARLGSRWETTAEVAYRLLVVVLSVAVAAALPNLGPIISLVGAVCYSTLGLLWPAVIETVALWERGVGPASWHLFKNALIAVFAVTALVSGSYASILEIAEAYG
ncbi:proton-coupled amino acid transporter-like protein pathetic isoform X1 [Schistocerca gregaria]|uniref:proton-coupled amino acid transporter-like protein pathetic isoform X1 n=2 Tax=Schistocerca gregaria TaxID=7010 RepID=UPI00211E1AE0|nr:proton-coupled amino acid transporter-like protein pathetic isoform X1 [Schistocerca gregaria]